MVALLAVLWDSHCKAPRLATAEGWAGDLREAEVKDCRKHRRSPRERKAAGVAMRLRRWSDVRLRQRTVARWRYVRSTVQASMMGSADKGEGSVTPDMAATDLKQEHEDSWLADHENTSERLCCYGRAVGNQLYDHRLEPREYSDYEEK